MVGKKSSFHSKYPGRGFERYGLLATVDSFLVGELMEAPGGSGFERIMTGSDIDAFNRAVKAGQISVKPIRIGY